MAPSSRFLSTSTAAAVLTLLGTGCAVYVPATPTTPLVSKGEVEVGVGGHLLPSPLVEFNAAYAPTAHLLATVETGFGGGEGSSSTNGVTTSDYTDHYAQGSVGLGYYQAPATPAGWYLAAVGGVGLASVALHPVEVGVLSPLLPLPLPYTSGGYEATYWRYYAQGYAATRISRHGQGGFSLRSTLVDYQQLTYNGQDIVPTNRGFVEPTGFLRFGKKAFYGQLNVGVTLPLSSDATSPYNKHLAPSSFLVGGSFVFRPSYWAHRDK